MSLPDTDTVPHHCKIAGRADTLFSDDAIALIHNASRGDRRVRYRSRHRRREGRSRRDQRKRRGLNPIRVDPTRTAST
jgi:hypothetical protein